MNNKKTLLQTALTLALIGSAHSVQALDTAPIEVLTFDAGGPASSYGAINSGSYYAMDTNGDGRFSPNERIAISPGPMGGITLGVLQPSSGTHPGCPNGTESPGPDMPWCFFGNTGMHQVTGTPVILNVDGTLDFSGWGVSWNGITNINLGSLPGTNSGLATVSCINTPCQTNDTRNLDYYAMVPLGDPSNFGGVGYMLHLANISQIPITPFVSIAVEVSGGNTQECNSTGGNTVSIQASYTLPTDDSLDTISWSLDGTPIAQGTSIEPFIKLGAHKIEASLITINGATGITTINIEIRDTTPPQAIAAFVDKHHNTPVTSIRHRGNVRIQAEGLDICDPAPTVTSMIGAPVENNSRVKANKHKGSVKLDVSSLTLSVNATDASNNRDSADAILSISE